MVISEFLKFARESPVPVPWAARHLTPALPREGVKAVPMSQRRDAHLAVAPWAKDLLSPGHRSCILQVIKQIPTEEN